MNKTFHNKLRGRYEAITLMCKANGTRYEFIFTQLPLDESLTSKELDQLNNTLSQLVSRLCRAYSYSKLYRELKLRSAIFTTNGKQLKLMACEQIYQKFHGVWNLSSDQGNLGVMHITNIRIIWHANMNELFNLSLPFVQIAAIKIRESKFGTALVIESTETSGSYVLGFRIDPKERLNSIYSQLCNLFNVHAQNPSFGVDILLNYVGENGANTGGDEKTALIQLPDDVDCDGDVREGGSVDVIAAYLAKDGQQSFVNGEDIVYSDHLGLAIERLKDGFTLQGLWAVG